MEWLINIFRGAISKRIRNEIQSLLCRSAHSSLIELLNTELSRLPTAFPLEDDFFLTYGLTSDPTATKDYVEGYFRTEITYLGENRTLVHPKPLPSQPLHPGRMLYIWGSDSILNTFLYSAHVHEALWFAVTKNVSREVKHVLRTSCSFLCLGQFWPELHKHYPRQYVDIVVSTAEPPQAVVREGYAVLEGVAYADLYLNPWNETELKIARWVGIACFDNM